LDELLGADMGEHAREGAGSSPRDELLGVDIDVAVS